MLTQYFEFGRVLVTAGAEMALEYEEIFDLLRWHGQLKKGDLCEEDYNLNRMALKTGDRILSCYIIRGEKFYVITEGDRSYTTLMKAEEY